MHNTKGTPERVRWQVLWIHPTKKTVERRDFDHTLQEAVKLYMRVVAAGRKGATLRCCNMGWPPPDKYADREDVVVVVKGKRMRGRKIIEPKVYFSRMGEMNLKGIWWCPYCQQMRKFKFVKGIMFDGRWVPRPSWVCPMCHISNNDWHVRKYNPEALKMTFREGRVSNPASQTEAAQRRRERRAARKLALEKEQATPTTRRRKK